MAMAILMILLDPLEAARLGWIKEWTYAFGPESARVILSAIAGAMITVAGVTFSMTMLTLQLASSPLGPRMLRNFMGDRGNEIVLGLFAGRHFPLGRITDQDMKLRVVLEPASSAQLTCSAFAAVARYGIGDADLVARLLTILERCSRGAPPSDRETILLLHKKIIVKGAANPLP